MLKRQDKQEVLQSVKTLKQQKFRVGSRNVRRYVKQETRIILDLEDKVLII